jgi:hypothetical protein
MLTKKDEFKPGFGLIKKYKDESENRTVPSINIKDIYIFILNKYTVFVN